MLKITPPTIDNISLLNDIVRRMRGRNPKSVICQSCTKDLSQCKSCAESNQGMLSRQIAYITSRYRTYYACRSSLDRISPSNCINEEETKLMMSAFHHSTTFQTARAKIFEEMPSAIKGKCPFCMLSEPNTLDHYFPESLYPEFILYSYNLVPCCSRCNSLKGNSLFGSNPYERTFFHFYFDSIPTEELLNVNIKMDGKIPIIEFYLDIDENIYSHRVFRAQFESLRLAERYKSQCNSEISMMYQELREFISYGHSWDTYLDIIRTKIKSFRREYGSNYWKATLYEGFYNNPSFLFSLTC